MPAKKSARAASSRSNGRSGIAERTFQEIRSSLDSLRDLMESYMPVGRAGVKARRQRRASSAAVKNTKRTAAAKSKRRARRSAAG